MNTSPTVGGGVYSHYVTGKIITNTVPRGASPYEIYYYSSEPV